MKLKRRRNFKQLSQEIMNSAERTEACKRAFEQTSKQEVETRENIAREYIHSFVREYLLRIDFLERVSPTTAKDLRNVLVNWEKIAIKRFTKAKTHKEELIFTSNNNRDKFILDIRNDAIDISINQGMQLHRNFIDYSVSAALEAMRHAGNKPPIQIDEYISNLLLKYYPKFFKVYEGAWQAFESNNPDKFRHTSASLRELIKNILGADTEKRRKTLKQLSVSETENDFIESLVQTLYANDRLLNKGVHSDLEENVATLSMKTTEIVLQYILERQKSNEI